MRLLALLLFAPSALAQSADPLPSPPADVVMRHADRDIALEVVFAPDGALLTWRCVVSPHPSLCGPTAAVAALAGASTWRRDGRPDVFRLPVAFWLPANVAPPDTFAVPTDTYVPPWWHPAWLAEQLVEYEEERPLLLGGLAGLQAHARYPDGARADGVEGRVFVQFILDERGRVEAGAGCVRSPDERLCDAALAAVRDARFVPSRLRGRPVRIRFALPVTFRLDDAR